MAFFITAGRRWRSAVLFSSDALAHAHRHRHHRQTHDFGCDISLCIVACDCRCLCHCHSVELRLGHIEARLKVPAWLARTLSQCKRALLRGRGPKYKAAELRFQTWWQARSPSGATLPRPCVGRSARTSWPTAGCFTGRGGRPGERDHPVVRGSLEPALVPEPHLPVVCQDIGQEELFVLAMTVPANRRKHHVRASVHWTAPSHAWSTHCGWYFAAQGFQLLRRSQVEEALYDMCKLCWKLEEGQPAA